MWLNESDFKHVVALTPLVSIDLIVKNSDNKVLLGQRLNRPAKDCWFVPGGRIQKNEKLDDAFHRLSIEELGRPLIRSHCKFLGVYEHLYADSVFGNTNKDPSTHYVVLAYETKWVETNDNLPFGQHAKFDWWSIDRALNDRLVHDNTKAYLL